MNKVQQSKPQGQDMTQILLHSVIDLKYFLLPSGSVSPVPAPHFKRVSKLKCSISSNLLSQVYKVRQCLTSNEEIV